MTTDKITALQAMELLYKARDTMGGDFVYNPGGTGSCMNVPTDDPVYAGTPKAATGCLVGTAMRLSGKVPEEFFPPRGSAGVFNAYLDSTAIAIMQMAQEVQDAGATWDIAVLAASHMRVALADGLAR